MAYSQPSSYSTSPAVGGLLALVLRQAVLNDCAQDQCFYQCDNVEQVLVKLMLQRCSMNDVYC